MKFPETRAALGVVVGFAWMRVQIKWVCFWDDLFDRIWPSRPPGTLVINYDRYRVWIERPHETIDGQLDN